MLEILLATRWGVFQEGRFMGKVLDEWLADGQEFVHATLPRLIGIAIIALLLNKLLRVITRRMVRVAENHGAGLARLGQVKTLAYVIRATGLAVIGTIAGLQMLAAFGVNLTPLLASAGIAGVAIGLAAQTIVKDMFNGILILIEGQFNVGDTVRIAGVSGKVETMTLRKTTVRDNDGTLYVIPNSQITTVANQSVDFAMATVNVSVDFSANPDQVIVLLKKIAMDVGESEDFKDLIIGEPKVLGLDSVKGSQLIFPVAFKTKPMTQFGVMREFQRRVRLALEENHLLPGDPMRIYGGAATQNPEQETRPAQSAHDPTTLKPQESNPFSGE